RLAGPSRFARRIVLVNNRGGAGRKGDGSNDKGTTQKPRLAPAVPSLRLRQDHWQRALPAMPHEVARADARRPRSDSVKRYVDRDARDSRSRELLRGPLRVGPQVWR